MRAQFPRILGVAALLHLAQTLPPAILADLLGISESRAAWTRTATGDWARYAAETSRQLQRGMTGSRPHR